MTEINLIAQQIIHTSKGTRFIGPIETDDPNMTGPEVIGILKDAGIDVRPHQPDAVDRAIEVRGHALSKRAKDNYGRIFGHDDFCSN